MSKLSWTSLVGLPWHTFLVAWLPFLHFHQKNFRVIGPYDGWLLLVVYWLVVLALLGMGRLIWKSWARAGLVLTPLVAVLAKGWALGGWGSLGLLALSIILALALWKRPDLEKAAPAANAALLVLVLFPLLTCLNQRHQVKGPQPTPRFNHVPQLETSQLGYQPDVYYLLVDGLGQPAFVERTFKFPRHLLTHQLQKQGFRVLENSRANYPQTALSSAATLNMLSIPDVLEITDPESRDRRPLARVVSHSRVARAFQESGYNLITFPSGYPLTRLAHPEHRLEPTLKPSFVGYYVLADGFLPLIQPLLGKGPAELSFSLRRGRLNFIFDHLPNAREKVDPGEPIFVFAHILAPHPPFVFDLEGNPQPSRARFTYGDGNDWHSVHDPDGIPYHRLWTGQAIHVMNRLNEAVQQILAQSPNPPVIIIQGDHGPGSQTHWDSVGGTNHDERFGIFNAWYVPPGVDLPLQDDMTSINTFPLLFNGLFGTDLPLSENRHWFARMKEPYKFFEVKAR